MEYISIDHPIILHLFSDGSLRPSLMAGYGPYQNLEEAQRELTAIFGLISNVPQGYTFCIIKNSKPVEYWFYKRGGWFVEPKNTSTSSSSSGDASYLGLIAMKIDNDGFLWLSISGDSGPWQKIGSVRQPTDLTKIKLGITGGNLYITYDGSDPRTSPTRTYVGSVGGDGVVIEGDTTYLKFDTDGTLLVKYGEEGSWDVLEGSQYQGKKIDKSVFQNLLKQNFKIAVIDDYIKYSYDGGINWTELHKLSEESVGPSAGDKYKATFKVYYNGATGEDHNTVLLVDNNAVVNGDSMYLENGEHYVTATCTGYVTKTVNFTIENSSVTVNVTLERDASVPSCRFRVTVLDQYNMNVTTPATVIIDGKERDVVTVFSGASVNVEIMYEGYYDYNNTFYDITSDTNQEIKLTVKPETQESEWTYHIVNGLENHQLVHTDLLPNTGNLANVSHIITAYRRNKVSGVQERLQLVRAFNPDGDPNGASMIVSQRPTTASDQVHSPYSIYMELAFPEAQYDYLHGGYKYKVQFDWQDEDGNTLFTTDSWNYEGFWERHIELYAQDVYVDNVYGSTVVLRVDSYCIQDSRCPGGNDYIYPCPVDLILKSGITQLAYDVKYLDWTKDGSTWPDWSVEHDDYGHGSYAEIRNVFTLRIGEPSNISGVTVDSATGNYLIPIGLQQIKQQNPLYMFQDSAYDFVPSDGSLIQDTVTVECRTHEATGQDRTAVGDIVITKDKFMTLTSAQRQLRTMLIKSIYREQANSTAENYLTFCGAKVEIYSPELSLIYSAKVNPVNTSNNIYGYRLTEEEFHTDNYIIGIECRREYAQISGSNVGAPTKNIEIRFCHNHNYMEDRTYIVEVTPFGGETYQFNFTLEAANLDDGALLYSKQYMDTSAPGRAYFAISGNHSEDSMDVSQVALAYAEHPRTNRTDTTVTPVSASEAPLTVNPLGGMGDQNLGISEPVRINNSVTVTWFRVDFPEVPNTVEDIRPNNTLIYVKDDDLPGSDWAFFGRQKQLD